MTDQTTALVPAQEPRAIAVIKQALEDRIDDIAAVLPTNMDPGRFVRTALIAVSKSPDLLDCSQASLVRSIVEAAEVGLEPTGSLSRAWLAPFREKGKAKPEAKLMIGYQGLADLMRDTGKIRQVWAEVVYQGDEFEYELGMAPILRHVPRHATEDPALIQYVYACARFRDGEVQFHVMTRAQVEVIRARAFSRNSPAWTGSWPAMARKTALRQLANYVPLSTKAQGAIQRDDDAEFGATPPEAPQGRTASLREVVKARLAPPEGRVVDPETGEVLHQPAQDAPGRPEQEKVDSDATPGVIAAQRANSAVVEVPPDAPEHEVCGVVDEPFDCGPCVLDPRHKASAHRDARDQEWTSARPVR